MPQDYVTVSGVFYLLFYYLYSGKSYLVGNIQTDKDLEDRSDEAASNVNIVVHNNILVSCI